MTHPLLSRLDQIAGRLAAQPTALAMLALGSVGRATERLDDHSDLDFFVITTDKETMLADLSWLGEPLRWRHRNTPDGYQVLVGPVFHEFAVFEPHELAEIPFEAGRIVWAAEGFDTSILDPGTGRPTSADWLIHQVLANLYVGLHRYLRGERLSAMRKIQGEALEALLRLCGSDDPFDPFRRAEAHAALRLNIAAGGYDRVPESAREILRALPRVESQMLGDVEALLDRAVRSEG